MLLASPVVIYSYQRRARATAFTMAKRLASVVMFVLPTTELQGAALVDMMEVRVDRGDQRKIRSR